MPLEPTSFETLAAEFESRLREGQRLAISEFVARVEPASRNSLASMLEAILARHQATGGGTYGATKTYQPQDPQLTNRDVPTASMSADRSDTDARPELDIRVQAANDKVPDKIGPYDVFNKIAEHGQGIVYRANHPTLNRQVVIKLSNSKAMADTPKALIDEARVLAQLNHPNVATVYDLQIHDGQPYLVMEYIEGRNLGDTMKERQFTPPEAIQLLVAVCSGLQHAHDLGVLHLDLKPQNIVLRANDKVPKIIDFGLAQLRPAYGSVTPNSYGGSFRYMAPEQAIPFLRKLEPGAAAVEDSQPSNPAQLDARADLYALGAILFELLTGTQLRSSTKNKLEAVKQAAENRFDPSQLENANVPQRLKEVCLRALSTKPEERFSSASEFATALSTVGVQSIGRRSAILVAVLTICAGLLGIGYSISVRNPARLNPPELKIELFTPVSQESTTRHGFIGRDAESATFGQHVRIHAKLPEPAYCYLFALNPSDNSSMQLQLCYPEQPNVKPERLSNISYPPNKTDYFPLTDGIGQQVFVLITSPSPLKDFATWRTELGDRLTWKPTSTEGVWKYSQGEISQEFAQSDVRGAKLTVGPSQLDATLKSLQAALHNNKQKITVIAFPVNSR